MRVGTKSVLFGAHCFFLHPLFVAWAWTRLYGFPWDPRLWVAFFLHDLGYVGSPNMDGPEGERHPEWAAERMFQWFDGDHRMVGSELSHWSRQGGVAPRYGGVRFLPHPKLRHLRLARLLNRLFGRRSDTYWHDLVLYHSRFYAKADHAQPSRLCIADKLAICLTPWWLYLPMVRATGEIDEYMALARVTNDGLDHGGSQKRWFLGVQEYVRKWVDEHRDGRPDTWTPDTRKARDDSGVWE
jgi:hypothetical protein